MGENQRLFDRLQAHFESGPAPLHMPGHQRNLLLADYLAPLGAGYDITEIDGFDDLHGADGVLAGGMARAASLWGSRRAWYLVNGSTCGILAGVWAATQPGDEVLVSRICHKSVYHAMELRGLCPHYILPAWDARHGAWGSLSAKTVEDALDACPNARLLVLTDPTYEGVLSDLPAIVSAAHARGVPVLVDEAHGAHLGFGRFPPGAVAAGADLVVQSVHKTLAGLTQTGLLHLNGKRVDEARICRALSVFETSSPSYLLMASLDACVQLLEARGPALFGAWEERLARFDGQISGLRRLRAAGHAGDADEASIVFGRDPSKLVLCTQGTALTGPQLMTRLRLEWGIEPEMASAEYVVAMTGLGTTDQTLERLGEALLDLDGKAGNSGGRPTVSMPGVIPPRVMTPAQALSLPMEVVPLAQCPGRVSAEYVWAYPPGVPLIVPGEAADGAFLDCARQLLAHGVALRHTACGGSGSAEGFLHVVSEDAHG